MLDIRFMITDEEYKKWKPLIDEYEENELADALANSLYCIECQALEAHDCFCDDHQDDGICSMCSMPDNNHYRGCPYNTDPYDQLCEEGYD